MALDLSMPRSTKRHCPVFPAEIVEIILYFADGCTLWNARRVCRLWKQTADFLIQKRRQMELCCQREMEQRTRAELAALDPEPAAVYRAWYRHGRLARWPVTTLAPRRLPTSEPGAMVADCVCDETFVILASGNTVYIYDLQGRMLCEVADKDHDFSVSQLAISWPPGAGPPRRLLAVGYESNMVSVSGLLLSPWQKSASPLVRLRTRTGEPLSLSACEDLVAVGYRWEAWLYRVRLGEPATAASTVCVVDLRSFDSALVTVRCCSGEMALLALYGGWPVWCEAQEVEADGRHGSLPYAVMSVRPRGVDDRQDDEAFSGVDSCSVKALDFNRANLALSLGAVLLLGHLERGCRQVDAFSVLWSRVTACCLHGRLLLLGTENGTLLTYFVPEERALLDVDLAQPVAKLTFTPSSQLRSIFVLEESRLLRVLVRDDDDVLHVCFWKRPQDGRLLWRQHAVLLAAD